jgi:tetratricopeptide (TPR) repeat protein
MTSIGNHAYVIRWQLTVAGLRHGGDGLRLAHAVRHLADAYHYARNATLAEHCYLEALSIYRARDDRSPLDLANALRGFAVLKDEAGETDGAHRLWLEAHHIYRSLNATAGIAESAARLALLARRQGDLQGSREWLAAAAAAADIAADPDTQRYVHEVDAELRSA